MPTSVIWSGCCSARRRTGRGLSRRSSTRLGTFRYRDQDHALDTERVHIAPFNLRDPARHEVVIDRLAYWYYHPREWLKKVALMDDVYLLNSPFTFQSMEKHSAYCALDPARHARARHRAGALQEPDRQRPLGLHRAQLQRRSSTWPRSRPRWATRCS